MVNSNGILYESGEHPDHVVVIKYVPYVADSKRAMDEYTSEIFMGGRNTIALHNTCEDSLLAAPIILDLVILAELLTRIQASFCSPKCACTWPQRADLFYLTQARSSRAAATPSRCTTPAMTPCWPCPSPLIWSTWPSSSRASRQASSRGLILQTEHASLIDIALP